MNLAGLPASLLVTEAVETSEAVVLQAQDLRPEVRCPGCSVHSGHLHSRYPRTLHDTALGDRTVIVHLQVRRLRCLNPACPRTTFAETWPDWLSPHAQRTTRLAQLQQSVGVALGGEAGTRLLRHLHEVTSADTLLRLIRRHPLPAPPDVHVLGVDDFCFRRGHTYGTLLIDLERHQVADVLPDRTAGTLAGWLTSHPGIQIISRDRFGDYARGAATGAPQAQQIADRFHLVKNLREVAEHWLGRLRVHRLHRPEITPDRVDPVDAAPVVEPFKQDAVPTTMSARVHRVIHRRDQRRALYERAASLHAQGHSVAATARLTGVGRSTLQDWFKADQFPGRATWRGALTPFVGFVRERLKTVDVSGQRLYDELVEQGFGGQRSAVYELLEWLRQGHLPPSMADHLPETAETRQRSICTARQGSWWFVRPPDALSPAARERLGLLQSIVEGSSTVYKLIQDFATLLRTRLEDASTRLTAWIDRARTSHSVELERFANGIQKDAAAVLGAITSPWSNGQTEGQVTRVKLIKRQMYGRAKFDLLRARILLA